VEIQSFDERHLDGVLQLCAAEGWPSLPEDPQRARRILTAPGVTTVVAVEGTEVVGVAEMFSDGELQAHLALLAVDSGRRHRGIGRALIEDALRRAGGERIDLLSEADATGFYEQLPHKRMPGFRVYPFER
jgi:ribosomal protein S18 acetylase RimI-like enzyme